MSIAQVRRVNGTLYGDCPEHGREYFNTLRGWVEIEELVLLREHDVPTSEVRTWAERTVAQRLAQGALRREVLHEDYGSAEQMRFAADVLLTHGVRGLR